MDTVALMRKVLDETTRLVGNLDDAALGQPAPCEGWKVRDVLNHITGGAIMFAVSAEQGSIPDEVLAQIMGDNLGADPQGAWGAAAARAVAAFEAPGALDKIVTLPFGQMPASIALNIAVFDVATHACDIAHGSGQQIDDLATFETALEVGKQIVTDELRKPGYFDAEQTAAPGAPVQHRLLAFAGRRI